jgi:hypothetical protein
MLSRCGRDKTGRKERRSTDAQTPSRYDAHNQHGIVLVPALAALRLVLHAQRPRRFETNSVEKETFEHFRSFFETGSKYLLLLLTADLMPGFGVFSLRSAGVHFIRGRGTTKWP